MASFLFIMSIILVLLLQWLVEEYIVSRKVEAVPLQILIVGLFAIGIIVMVTLLVYVLLTKCLKPNLIELGIYDKQLQIERHLNVEEVEHLLDQYFDKSTPGHHAKHGGGTNVPVAAQVHTTTGKESKLRFSFKLEGPAPQNSIASLVNDMQKVPMVTKSTPQHEDPVKISTQIPRSGVSQIPSSKKRVGPYQEEPPALENASASSLMQP
jgi:hypothetical protein